MRSNARTLLSQRLLGDLNDNLLPFLEKLGDGGQWSSLGTGKCSGLGTLLRTLLRTASNGFSRSTFAARFGTWVTPTGRSGCASSLPLAAATHLTAHTARQTMHIGSTLFADLRGERRGTGWWLFGAGSYLAISPGGGLPIG